MAKIYNLKLLAWDITGKVLEISYWRGFHGLEKAKKYAKIWFKHNHIGCDKWIKIYKDGESHTISEYRKFKNLPVYLK